MFLLSTSSPAGTPTLIISEYSEASLGNNKYVEIYNPLGISADLSIYKVWLISNGGYWPETVIDLAGTLADGDVFVIAHNKADPNIKVHSDLLTSKMNANGNDAIGLAITNYAGGWDLLDVVGTEGTNAPAVGWDVAGVSEATKDHTLVRRSFISAGTTNWTTSAGTTPADSQWTVLPDGTTTNLGFHGTPPEQPPLIVIEESDITKLVNSPISYTITVGDFNNDPITLSTDTAPAGAIFTPALDQVGTPILTNTFDWTPATAGDYSVTYTATDNDGSTTSTVSIHISGVLPPPEQVWINEIHYDNAAADTNEGVEVAGRAGIEMSAYRLVYYNGFNQEAYNTDTLTGTIADQQAGYGTAWYPATMQNSGPDAVALIELTDGQTNVLQFLSYEGEFAAADGPAKGFVSEDIGVEESGATPEGHSLQLMGSGNVYADFTWASPSNHTRGGVNNDQTFTAIPTLLILR